MPNFRFQLYRRLFDSDRYGAECRKLFESIAPEPILNCPASHQIAQVAGVDAALARVSYGEAGMGNSREMQHNAQAYESVLEAGAKRLECGRSTALRSEKGYRA